MSSKQPFEKVVTEHGTTVLRVCRAVLDINDADDAWSETFLSALRAYPELPDDADIEAWLVTIAHRKAIDITRARSRRAVPAGDLPDVTTTTMPEPDNDLADALARLPAKQKYAVAYHYLVGLPYSDVAAVLGVSPAAARRSAADGIKALRRKYVEPADSRETREPITQGTAITRKQTAITRKGGV